MPRTPQTVEGAECTRCGGTTRYVNSKCCVPCARLRCKEWRAREGDNHRARMRVHSRVRREQNPAEKLWRGAKSRAAEKGLDFSIAVADVAIPETCPLLEIPLKCGNGRVAPSSPTLDRISNDRGYVPGNVWVISNAANTCKGQLDAATILQLGVRLRLREAAIVL